MGIYSAMRRSAGRVANDQPIEGDPNPTDFSIEKIEVINGNTLAVIRYPGCLNYEGRKLLIYRGDVSKNLKSTVYLDPHFNESSLSPIARFEPTQEGERLAKIICQSL